MVAKPGSTSGPPRACQVMQISGSPASWPALREKEPRSKCESLGSGGDNAASHGQQLGGERKAPRGLQGPFQTNSSRKHQVQEAHSPSQANQSTKPSMFSIASGLLPFLLSEILFPSWASLTPSHALGLALVGTSCNSSAMVLHGKPHLTSSLGQGTLGLPPSPAFSHQGTRLVGHKCLAA